DRSPGQATGPGAPAPGTPACPVGHGPSWMNRAQDAAALVKEHFGVRTLDPGDREYLGTYRGNQRTRDAAYHQGTAWPWLMGPLLAAHHAIHGDDEFVLSALRPFLEHLKDAGLGSISEVVDGDAPHEPGGCIAQAWSVASTLDLWSRIQAGSGDTGTRRPRPAPSSKKNAKKAAKSTAKKARTTSAGSRGRSSRSTRR
ncbi:MAG: amylo-alpha-1,6-glucosidase, partial [Phycisphaerales bacterium]